MNAPQPKLPRPPQKSLHYGQHDEGTLGAKMRRLARREGHRKKHPSSKRDIDRRAEHYANQLEILRRLARLGTGSARDVIDGITCSKTPSSVHGHLRELIARGQARREDQGPNRSTIYAVTNAGRVAAASGVLIEGRAE